jgi:hypothetical protein
MYDEAEEDQERYCDMAVFWLDRGQYQTALNFCNKALECDSTRWIDYANQLKAEAIKKGGIQRTTEGPGPEYVRSDYYCAYCGVERVGTPKTLNGKDWCGCEIKPTKPFEYKCTYCGKHVVGEPKIYNRNYWCGCEIKNKSVKKERSKKDVSEVNNDTCSEQNVKNVKDGYEIKPTKKGLFDKIKEKFK